MGDQHLASLAAQAAAVGRALVARGLMLAVAESCTGGLLATALTATPGSSQWFECGLVTYSARAKEGFLGLPRALVSPARIVSTDTAMAMALAVRRLAGVAVGCGITGIAGPGGGRPDCPVGTVCLAWAGVTASAHTYLFAGDRGQVRAQAVATALDGLLALLATGADG